MSIFKCKMCGGSLEVPEGASSCTCDYCGTQQTVATVRDENLQGLFNRANVLRMKSEFDKAADIYERILQTNETEAEGYWGMILCKYGIEYVEDPKTYKRIPTCHRASYDAVTADEDYKNAIRYADTTQRAIYEREAAAIDEIQKGIILLAQKEAPYDVFICYKETDESGKRTQDSVIANDIYYQLTREGFKVFYAAITLESKLGSEYEPYIFSALNSAKVMLTIGTKPEYFNAVWVRNEWSRFLKLLKKDRSRLLIPCYKDMDPYELPEEFAHLQAQDMGKIGFINDLVRGIKKVLDAGKEPAKETVVQQTIVQQATGGYAANVQALLDRGTMALEDREWEKADGFFEAVLNQDAKCAEAYVSKFLAQQKASTLELLAEKLVAGYAQAKEEFLEACPRDKAHIAETVQACVVENYLDAGQIEMLYQGFDREYSSILSCRKKQKQELEEMLSRDRILTRALQYAMGNLKQRLDAFKSTMTAQMEARIAEAEQKDTATIADIEPKYAAFLKSMDEKAYQLKAEAEAKRQADYEKQVAVLDGNDIQDIAMVQKWFSKNQAYCNCKELADQAKAKLERLRAERDAADLAAAKKKKRITAIVAAATAAVIALAIVYVVAIKPALNYKNAVAFMQAEQYEEAIVGFEALGEYKDSTQQIENCKTAIKEKNYDDAISFMQAGQFEEAIAGFEALIEYKDSVQLINDCKYNNAVNFMQAGQYEEAIAGFEALGEYKDSQELMVQAIHERDYQQALSLTAAGDYAGAVSIFASIKGYKDVDSLLENDHNLVAAVAAAIDAKFTVGNYVTFGSYPQTWAGNDQSEIEWLVLARDGNKALLISRYALDTKPYNKVRDSITYENSTMRHWLNGEFLNKAFTAEEQGAIVTTYVTADINPKYSINPGNATDDKVFLLSIQEAEKYFKTDAERKCAPTDYAMVNGIWISYREQVDGRYTCWWWLRSPGNSLYYAAYVNFGGSVYRGGDGVDRSDAGVRPALWVNLESGIF